MPISAAVISADPQAEAGKPKIDDEELHQERRVANDLDVGVDKKPRPPPGRMRASEASDDADRRPSRDRSTESLIVSQRPRRSSS